MTTQAVALQLTAFFVDDLLIGMLLHELAPHR
jgi:hypothetical protein